MTDATADFKSVSGGFPPRSQPVSMMSGLQSEERLSDDSGITVVHDRFVLNGRHVVFLLNTLLHSRVGVVNSGPFRLVQEVKIRARVEIS